MYSFKTEFPDFDPATMPEIPSSWEDTSWRNDVCPSFSVAENFSVYIDYKDPKDREFDDPSTPRFFINRTLEDGSSICEMMTDDWDAILNYFEV